MANGENRTAVLLDQHPLWLNALERILAHAGVSPVAKATTTTAALGALEEHRPDLFVLDIDMNGCAPDGLTCLRNALARQPALKAVVVSATDDPERIEAALTGGAVAYVLKRAEPEDLASAVRQVFSRSLYLAGAEAFTRQPSVEDIEAVGLTRREREILQLVSEGNTNGQVAKVLWVTEQTVKFHLANIFRKLDVTNRTQASRWAHAHGLVQSSDRDERTESSPEEVLVGSSSAA
ncbi:MAG TPA: response regulator transcription factor [Actinomycetota bacterium]|nr:response regulator transcription factor [Actinomycetota bacterium]